MGLIPNGHLVFSLNPNCPVRSCPAGMSWGGAERLAGIGITGPFLCL